MVAPSNVATWVAGQRRHIVAATAACSNQLSHADFCEPAMGLEPTAARFHDDKRHVAQSAPQGKRLGFTEERNPR